MKINLKVIFVGLGSTLLFLSWVSQNYYVNKWKNDFEMQNRIHENIVLETCMNDIFMIESQRLWNEKSINYPSLATILLRQSMSAMHIMTLSDGLATQNPDSFNAEYRRTFEKLMSLHSSQRYEELILEADKIIKKYSNVWKSNPVLSLNLEKAYLQSHKWNKLFLALYIIGSIIISIGWLLGKTYFFPDTKDCGDRPRSARDKSIKKKKR